MAPSPKDLKEAFVSNLAGGTITEINLVTAVAPTAVLVWSVLQSRYGFFEEQTPDTFVADFLLNAGTVLLSTTLYSSSPATLLIILLLSTFVYRFSPTTVVNQKAAKSPRKSKEAMLKQKLSDFPIRPFLTAYRGGMMVITCSSILAVDFPVFPRRFAKVETWGTSLMDIGVGSFVFSAGLVAAKGAIKDQMLALDKDGKSQRQGMVSRAFTAVRQALPLLVLGIARLVSVKNLDYAEHVSEYGVHWNFFFTLAIVPLALAIVQPVISMVPGPAYAMTGLLLSVGHEVALQSTDLRQWALTGERVGLLAQNREGITSSMGYLAIFLLGMSTGTVVLPRDFETGGFVPKILDLVGLKPSKNSASTQVADIGRLRLIARLAMGSVFYWALLGLHRWPRVFPYFAITISRRLANFPYVLWIAAYNTAQITLYCLIESFYFPSVRYAKTLESEEQEAAKATSRVLDDFNAGGLFVFLVANLGTGLVNMTVDTLKAGPYTAIGILAAYMGLMTFAAKHLRAIKLKI